jgi:hypothetical protein
MISPYQGISLENWETKTKELIAQHPINTEEIVEIVNKMWEELFTSEITSRKYKIGIDLFPRPQFLGTLLHELIPLEFATRYPELWRKEEKDYDKDIVYIPNDYFSIELKTSSSSGSIYGNRSYAQKSTTGQQTKKNKSGYYLAVNFPKINSKIENELPKINKIRFGWLDEQDWLGQKAQTGQQARLSPEVQRYKLLELPLK